MLEGPLWFQCTIRRFQTLLKTVDTCSVERAEEIFRGDRGISL